MKTALQKVLIAVLIGTAWGIFSATVLYFGTKVVRAAWGSCQ